MMFTVIALKRTPVLMPSLHFPRRCLRYCTSAFLVTAGIFLVYFIIRRRWTYEDDIDTIDWPNIMTAPDDANATTCTHLPGMDKVLVILKTGASEILDKVPIHLETSFQCLQHYAIFSDYEEDILGTHAHDVLRSVSEETQQTSSDFGIYNRLTTSGRDGLLPGDWNEDENGPFGKPGNPGWKLDKWKFVPMVDEGLLVKPDADWFVFLEADTYIIWQNMARWLSRLDQTKAQYLGAPMQMDDEIFAYGGSGIVLSRSAMQLVSKYRAENFAAVEQMTEEDWAGDHVLGKILIEMDIPLVWAWPSLNPANVWEFEYLSPWLRRLPWCYPAVSFHHMSTQDIQDMWLMEQQWFKYKKDSALLHKDILQWQISDGLNTIKEDWDNLSEDQQPQNESDSPSSIEECAERCLLTTECLQYSYSDDGCKISETVVGGVRRQGVQSGWMETRVKALMKNAGRCRKTKYITE